MTMSKEGPAVRVKIVGGNVEVSKNEEEALTLAEMEAHLDELIDSNLGYNKVIEEDGFNISGGQKQRIVLARTLLKDFEILLIDEGMNQIDINLERKMV